MNLMPVSSLLDKWQDMQIIINQHASLIQLDHQQYLKKMVISRFFRGNALAFFLQFSGLMISTLIPTPSPIWFASGTACALLFLKGVRILPGIYLASLAAYSLSNISIQLAIILAFLPVLQALLLLWVSYRYIYPTLLFYQNKLLIKFILCAAIITATFSLTLVLLCYSSLRDPILLPTQLWLCWALANFNGTIIFSFSIIAWDAYFPQADFLSRKDVVLFICHFLFLLALIIGLVLSEEPMTTIGLTLLSWLTVVIIFLRYGQFGFIFSIFSLGFLLGMSACLSAPIWMTSFSTTTLFYLQFVVALECSLGLLLSVHRV